MTIEPILRRQFSDADRSAVQEAVASAVERNPEQFIERYRSLEQSLGGRYVSADLFKETFEQYGASKDSRNRYNAPVHNAAAVLASEYLRRLISAPDERVRDAVILLTGIPGAGKTSSILDDGELPARVRAIYEGQLSKPETAFAKVQQVLEAGLKPVIVAVHATPEKALENTLQRFEELGRGATIGIMVMIQGGLPDSLQAVRERFGDQVDLQIVDRRIFHESKELKGWQHLPLLRSEGDHEHITQRLHQALAHHRAAGRVDDAAYRQALGLAPGPKHPELDSSAGEENERARHERDRTQENRQEALLKTTPAATTSPDLRPDSMLTADELRQRECERRLDYPRTHSREPGPESEKDQGAEQDPEKSPDHGTDRDSGIGDDFAL